MPNISINKERECISCNKVKPATTEYFFYRNKARGWFSSWCKDCRVEKRKETFERELLLQRNRRGLKPCSICGSTELAKMASYCTPCYKTRKRAQKKLDKAVYKSRLRKAIPKWANREAIREIYANRPEGMHVDHIIPLRGELVCGLHIETNLQYLTKEINMMKSNRFQDGNHYSLNHGSSS